jgi:hypothetical protein
VDRRNSPEIAALEQEISKAYRLLPVGIDLIRNARYLGVALIVFAVWGTWCVARRLEGHRSKLAVVAVALVYLAINRPGSIPVRDTLQCWATGKLLCPRPEWASEVATLHFLRDGLPQRTRVLAVLQQYVDLGFEMAIRYHALQPMVFNPKDAGSTLSYGNWEGLRQWLEIEGHPARHPPENANRLAYARDLARATSAEVLVTILRPDPEVPDARLLFNSGRFHVYAIGEMPVPAREPRS